MANSITIIGRVSQNPVMLDDGKNGKEVALFTVHDKEAKKVFACYSKINNITIVKNLKLDQMVTIIGELKRKHNQDYVQVNKCHYERAEKCHH